MLAAGWALGGTVGVGTVVYAASIGPLAHVFIPLLAIPWPPRAGDGGSNERRRRRPRSPQQQRKED